MITKEQQARLRKAIDNDCAEAGHYFNTDDTSKTCVIGALIREASVWRVKDYVNNVGVRGLPMSVLLELEQDTGLHAHELTQLQRANDSIIGAGKTAIENRRKAVHAVLDQIIKDRKENT